MPLFAKKTKKLLTIEGMKCAHCSAHCEQALNAIKGVKAKADHEKNCAVVTITGEVSDSQLTDAVAEAGYTVTAISDAE